MNIKFNQRNLKIAIAASILVGPAGLTVPAYAETSSSNMAVTSNIGMNCTISTGDISFGAYKPTTDHLTDDLEATGSVTTRCTVGSGGKIIISEGLAPGADSSPASPLRRMGGPADGDYLLYQVYSDSDRALVWSGYGDTGIPYNATGSDQEMTVYASITAGQTTSPEGSYSDTLVVTVNY